MVFYLTGNSNIKLNKSVLFWCIVSIH